MSMRCALPIRLVPNKMSRAHISRGMAMEGHRDTVLAGH